MIAYKSETIRPNMGDNIEMVIRPLDNKEGSPDLLWTARHLIGSAFVPVILPNGMVGGSNEAVNYARIIETTVATRIMRSEFAVELLNNWSQIGVLLAQQEIDANGKIYFVPWADTLTAAAGSSRNAALDYMRRMADSVNGTIATRTERVVVEYTPLVA